MPARTSYEKAVRPSVKRVYCDKTEESSVQIFIYLLYKSYTKYRKNKKEQVDRREQLTRTQITRDVREVTSSERVRQTYQSVSKHSTLLH